MPCIQTDRRALTEPRQRCDQQALLAERRPVALGVLDQLVGLRHPQGAAAALEPVVEKDAGDLAALAGPGAVAKEPAAAEADRGLGVVRCRGHNIEGLVDDPRSGEISRVRFARIDDALELGVGEQAVGNEIGWQVRPIGGLGWRDRCHGGGLDEPGRMRRQSRNTDRLKCVAFIERLGDAPAFRRRPVDCLVAKLDASGFDDRGGGPTC